MTEAVPRGVVTASETADRVRILIDGVPHIVIDRRRFAGFQAWKVRDWSLFVIEITLAEAGVIKTEYDDRAVWERVLQTLGEVV